ncbi:hypothetical protein D3C72_1902530 [compost metagenome]
MLGIRGKRRDEAVFLAKLDMALDAVGRNAEKPGAQGCEGRGTLGEFLVLVHAAARIVLGIEIEHHGPAALCRKLESAAIVEGQGEVGGAVAFAQIGHCKPSVQHLRDRMWCQCHSPAGIIGQVTAFSG